MLLHDALEPVSQKNIVAHGADTSTQNVSRTVAGVVKAVMC